LLDEKFEMLSEDDLALLTQRFGRMYENHKNTRRSLSTCYKCGKTGHFFAECLKKNNNGKHKVMDKRRRPKKKDHGHGRKT
jgi:hypothetical protein